MGPWFTAVLHVLCFGLSSVAVFGEQFQGQFLEDVNEMHSSKPFVGNSFQYVKVVWIRLDGNQHDRVVKVKYECPDDVRPQTAWMVNGRLVSDDDTVLTVKHRSHGVTSIQIPHVISVTQLQLLLVLEAVDTLVDISLQDIEEGKTIVEHGTDVALALSSQEDVTYQDGDQLRYLTRFFAEDLTGSSYSGLHVRFTRMSHTDPATVLTLTSESDPEYFSVVEPSRLQLPGNLRKSSMNDYRYVTLVANSTEGARGMMEFVAAYDNNSPCRLFGGQKITRRTFVRPEHGKGSYWAPNARLAFLPLQDLFIASCHSTVEVKVTVFGEPSPDVTLMKSGHVIADSDVISVFLFRRLPQTEAVFRFSGVDSDMAGTYTVRARSGDESKEVQFELRTDEICR